MVDFYGYSQDDFTNKKISDLNTLPPEKIDSLMKEAITKDANFFEFKHKLADGSIKYVEVFSSLIIYNNSAYVIVTVHDIDKRKKIEETVNKLLMAVEQSANTIVITDAERNIEYVNPKFIELTGYTKKEPKAKREQVWD